MGTLRHGLAALAVALLNMAPVPGYGQTPPPQVRDLARTTFQNFVCTQLVNFFARNQSFQASELVMPQDKFHGNDQKVAFSNLIHNEVCGAIVYRYPASCEWREEGGRRICHLSASKITESERAEARVKLAHFRLYGDFFAKSDELAREVAPYFLPTEKYGRMPADLRERIGGLVRAFQADIEAQHRGDPQVFGSIRADVPVVPEATPPSEALRSYPSAWAAYLGFLGWLDGGAAPQ